MKTCCDYECAMANGCQVGGLECDRCGEYFCSNELAEHNGEYVCDDCKKEMESEEEEGDTDEQES